LNKLIGEGKVSWGLIGFYKLPKSGAVLFAFKEWGIFSSIW
jgi:hypothetical protein